MNNFRCKNEECNSVFIPCISCLNSKSYYGYRKDFCSIECFQYYMSKGSDKVKKYPMTSPIRGKIFDEDKMVDIIDFDYESLNNHYFIDHYKTRREINDFFYLILYREVLIDLLKASYEHGYKEGIESQKNIKKTRGVKRGAK